LNKQKTDEEKKYMKLIDIQQYSAYLKIVGFLDEHHLLLQFTAATET